MENELIITGESAKQMTEFFGWPYREPTFIYTKEGDGIYGTYDSGLDYDKDGHTFDWDWMIYGKNFWTWQTTGFIVK